MVADASALQQFDSSALAVLLECRREALAHGQASRWHSLPPRLRELAALYGVAELLPAAALSRRGLLPRRGARTGPPP